MCSKIVEEILSHLKYLGSTDQLDKQSILALELFNCFVIRADLREPALANMAVNLWNLSQRHGSVDPKVAVNKYLRLEYFTSFASLNIFKVGDSYR